MVVIFSDHQKFIKPLQFMQVSEPCSAGRTAHSTAQILDNVVMCDGVGYWAAKGFSRTPLWLNAMGGPCEVSRKVSRVKELVLVWFFFLKACFIEYLL